MTKWPRLRQLADHLFEIAEEGAAEKTASEVEAEMEVYLLGELGPLLEKFDKLIFLAGNHLSDATRKDAVKERSKWQK